LLLATTAVALTAGLASAEDIKIGVILGFTGPIESITPDMGETRLVFWAKSPQTLE
jgi:branched-chain amino acid transport system substrate-binding protein